MAKLTKKQKTLQGKIDSNRLYPVAEALALVKDCATAKFDESIDVAVQLGVDAKKSDQVVRGAVVLPNGSGKTTTLRILACALAPTSGRVAVAGFDVTTHSLDVRRRIGYLPDMFYSTMFGTWLDKFGDAKGYPMIFIFLACTAVVGSFIAGERAISAMSTNWRKPKAARRPAPARGDSPSTASCSLKSRYSKPMR